MIYNTDSSKVQLLETASHVISQALDYLHDNNHDCAQVMVAIARQMLEDAQEDFNNHLAIERMLRQMLNPLLSKSSPSFRIEESLIIPGKSILLIEPDRSISNILCACLSTLGNPPALLGDSPSLTVPGV
jgi:hypothetical protein